MTGQLCKTEARYPLVGLFSCYFPAIGGAAIRRKIPGHTLAHPPLSKPRTSRVL